MYEDSDTEGTHSKGWAFLLWFAFFFGIAGIHRFYLGRPVSGFLYLITWGFLGFGQVFDLFLLPGMVAEANTKNAALRALAEKRALQSSRVGQLPAAFEQQRQLPEPSKIAETPEQMRMKLLEAAAEHGGFLSVTQGVMATGRSFEDVEQMLDYMAQSGYVEITNDSSGHVVYNFGQLD